MVSPKSPPGLSEQLEVDVQVSILVQPIEAELLQGGRMAGLLIRAQADEVAQGQVAVRLQNDPVVREVEIELGEQQSPHLFWLLGGPANSLLIEVIDQWSNEGKVDGLVDLAQGMILGYKVFVEFPAPLVHGQIFFWQHGGDGPIQALSLEGRYP